ncbi:glutaredoxin family protein [Simiduia curdlanivorans]|uniref:Glutaredoxin family protein n=1 Tax=Simiduia curdlanivorans TaxID=1492769 RepID=A0ABV8V881_9GAMM|nr:glutaredoxin family protein [Simiduia curdlanivorans]MDN3639555.1 glutaredoxin family protein [Simiduia curdlanivorans]
MKTLILFATSGCHLCSVAENIVAKALDRCPKPIQFIEKDIADSDELIESYGTRIPVLRVQDCEAELSWPFTEAQVIRFLNA